MKNKYFVLYRIQGLPRVKEFDDACKAFDFAHWAGGKVCVEEKMTAH